MADFTQLTASEFAALVGVSDKTVRNWFKENGLPFTETTKGRVVESVAALKWWHKYLLSKDGNDGSGATFGRSETTRPVSASTSEPEPLANETFDQAELRKAKADATLSELKVARALSEVVAIADLERILSSANKAVQTQMLAMPANLADRVLGMEDVGAIRAVISKEVDAVLTNLATLDAVREGAEVTE